MLKALHFTNFKSWASVDLIGAPITGVFGPNSSGKTSLIQFLLLLKQTKDATDRRLALELNDDLVQLGTIKDAIHGHDERKLIQWQLEIELDRNISVSGTTRPGITIARGNTISIKSEIKVDEKSSAPISRLLSYKLGRTSFTLAPKNGDFSQFELRSETEDSEKTGFSFIRTKGRPWQLPGPIKSYAFPDQARTYFQNASFLADLEAAYEAQIDRIFYLGPLREFPRRDYLWARSRPGDVGQRGEKAVDAILAATEAHEVRNLKPKARRMPFQAMVAHWLREMGLIQEFTVTEIAPGSNRWQARVKTRADGSEVLLTDVGFGVSQVLPVVTLLQYVPTGSTVILEQPEIHLHPLAQAGLADVIIQAATHRRVQVILESHSEHLLLRLQRRIAEGLIGADAVKLYFCEAPKGASILTPLDVDLLGEIRNWPDRFMGDAFGEVAEAELARLRRSKAAE